MFACLELKPGSNYKKKAVMKIYHDRFFFN